MHRMSKQDTARRRRGRYDAVLAFFVFLGDPASPFRFFLVPSTGAASALLGFDGLLVGCVAGVVSTSISPESSIGARDPSGAKRCLSSSGGCLGRGGFWCTTGEDSGDDAGGVGRVGRAEITRRRETACGAALHSIVEDGKRRATWKSGREETDLGTAFHSSCGGGGGPRRRGARLRRRPLRRRPLVTTRRTLCSSCRRSLFARSWRTRGARF